MNRIFYFCTVILLFVLVNSGVNAQQAKCPANSHVDHEDTTTVHCKCNAGFEKRNGECKTIPVMLPNPESSMQPLTRAQCLKFQEDIRHDGLAGCRSDLYYCMIEQGSNFPAAWCALGIAISGLAPISLAGVAGAIVNCGEKAQAVYSVCEPKLTACTNAISSSYPKGISSCPSN